MSNFFDTPDSGSSGIAVYKMRDGVNKIRLVGDVIPRYVYWTKTAEGSPISVESLEFDRKKARFTREVADPFLKHFPYQLDKFGNPVLNEKTGEPERSRCSWSYVQLCLDLNEEPPTLKVFFHKKTLFSLIKKLGMRLKADPTCPENGWDVVFEKEKTGSARWNVEYNLDQISSAEAKRPLSPEELELLENTSPEWETYIWELFPRPSVLEVERLIQDKILSSGSSEEDEDQEAVNELENA